MSKILIVEDDEKLSKELKIFLEKNGYTAVILQKFDNAVEDILEENSDLILLDINLPYTDGEYICKEIRRTSNVPIIMVTSRDNEIDELLSLNYGAEQKARATYEKLIDLCRDNPDVIDPLRFLREREIVHFQRFGEALRIVQDKLSDKKFCMNDMNNIMQLNNNCGR